MTAQIVKIVKRYTQSISKDKQLWSFTTELEASVEVHSKEELVAASDKLFAQVKGLTELDIKKCIDEIQPKQG